MYTSSMNPRRLLIIPIVMNGPHTRFFAAALCLCVLNVLPNWAARTPDHSLLIVSFDGFRHDYPDRLHLPHFLEREAEGAHGKMLNVFETKTFPNHHSLATGLYPEDHGVIANHVYDPLLGRNLSYSRELWEYDMDRVTPIWTLNELRGGRSGVMMWPGSEFHYRGDVLPSFVQPWNSSWPWQERVNTALDWMKPQQDSTAGANLVMLYIEEPDTHSHAFGTHSPEVLEQLIRLDMLVGYLTEQLEARQLTGRVDVFLLSDHGMSNTREQRIIDLATLSNVSNYFTVGTSPVLHVFPHQGMEEVVLSELQQGAAASSHFGVFTKENMPAGWHLMRCRRAPPIVLVAEEGYAFQDLREAILQYARVWHFQPTPEHEYGIHGYDNSLDSMHPYFVAWGPRIRHGVEIPPFESVQLYNLWAHLLGARAGEDPASSTPFSMLEAPSSAINLIGVLLVATLVLGALGAACWRWRQGAGRRCGHLGDQESASKEARANFTYTPVRSLLSDCDVVTEDGGRTAEGHLSSSSGGSEWEEAISGEPTTPETLPPL